MGRPIPSLANTRRCPMPLYEYKETFSHEGYQIELAKTDKFPGLYCVLQFEKDCPFHMIWVRAVKEAQKVCESMSEKEVPILVMGPEKQVRIVHKGRRGDTALVPFGEEAFKEIFG